MKKFMYIVLLLVVLLGIAYVLKNQQANNVGEVAVEEEVFAEEAPAVAEDTVVVVDEEPSGEEVVSEGEVEAEDVVEENPEETAGEGETVVE